MAAALAAAAIVGGDFVSGLIGSSKQKKALKKWKNKTLSNIAEEREEQRQGLVRQEGLMKRGLADVIKSYDTAKKEVALGAADARREVYDEGKRATGAITQGAISRGTLATDAYTAAQRGVSADIQRSIARVNTDLADTYANLSIAGGAAKASARAGLAGFYQHYAKVQSALNDDDQAFLDAYYGMKMAGVGQGPNIGDLFSAAGSAYFGYKSLGSKGGGSYPNKGGSIF